MATTDGTGVDATFSSQGEAILGWALVSTVDKKPYYDEENHHIPDDEMLRASLDYMLNSRRGLVNHRGGEAGEVLFSFPFTVDLCGAFEIGAPVSGWAVCWRPFSQEIMDRAHAGEFSGFSIRGIAKKGYERSEFGHIIRGLVDRPAQALAMALAIVDLPSLFSTLPLLNAFYSNPNWDRPTALPTARIRGTGPADC